MSASQAAWCAGWRALHPDWEYYLWDVESIYDLDEEIGECIITCNRLYSSKSDLAMIACVYHLGGIYLNVNLAPNKALDPIIAQGMEAFFVQRYGEPAADVFGSVPKTLWLELCREAAISFAMTPPPWAPAIMCEIAKRYGVTELDTELFYSL